MLLHRSHPFPNGQGVLGRQASPPSSTASSSKRFISCTSSFSQPKFCRPYTCVMIVPTGVGASIGGFAGDALPVARTLASLVDCLISHPNIGLVLDAGIEEDLRVRHLQVADATRASLGLPVIEYVVTNTPLQIGYTFLPCVLVGLSRAPQYFARKSVSSEHSCILASDVDSVILPIDACGGEGTLAFGRSGRHKPLIIAVEENETVLSDTPEKLGIDAVQVSNYWEGLGVIAAHKAGIDPQSLRRNGISNIRCSSILPSYNGRVAFKLSV